MNISLSDCPQILQDSVNTELERSLAYAQHTQIIYIDQTVYEMSETRPERRKYSVIATDGFIFSTYQMAVEGGVPGDIHFSCVGKSMVQAIINSVPELFVLPPERNTSKRTSKKG